MMQAPHFNKKYDRTDKDAFNYTKTRHIVL
jgi:hypothetical protein